MEDNKELVEETENTELTAEEIEDVETPEVKEEPKEETTEPVEEMIPKSMVKDIVEKRLVRQENKLRKEYAKKYGKLETVVNAGLGTKDVNEAVDKLTEFYQSKGISIPSEPQYSHRDLEVLANAEAEDIISEGYETIVDEVNRMAQLDPSEMSERDKLVFTRLANKRKEMEEVKELASIGVKLEDLDDDFKAFNENLNQNLSLKKRYELYQANKEKQEIKKIGSMKGVPESKLKDYYTPEEISKLTDEDLDDPRVWEAVRRSMTHQN